MKEVYLLWIKGKLCDELRKRRKVDDPNKSMNKKWNLIFA